MRAAEVFFDSSVLCYLLAGQDERADEVERLLLQGGHLNVQVLNEIASVALRKRALTIEEVREFLAGVRELCHTHAMTVDTHERGLDIAQRYRFALYDSTIIAAALDAGCRTLYSEDLQHGQVIEKRLRVVNPFSD
jgi:predicted nucleic acid-binding protein